MAKINEQTIEIQSEIEPKLDSTQLNWTEQTINRGPLKCQKIDLTVVWDGMEKKKKV